MTPGELIDWFVWARGGQRATLTALRERLFDELRAMPDPELDQAIRTIKKQLNSPKLAGEVGALIAALREGRTEPPPTATNAAPAAAGSPATTVTAPEAALVAAIEAAPDSVAPDMVYGDQLAGRGDPRRRADRHRRRARAQSRRPQAAGRASRAARRAGRAAARRTARARRRGHERRVAHGMPRTSATSNATSASSTGRRSATPRGCG